MNVLTSLTEHEDIILQWQELKSFSGIEGDPFGPDLFSLGNDDVARKLTLAINA